jgi:iron complex transport system substrate-binding protein
MFLGPRLSIVVLGCLLLPLLLACGSSPSTPATESRSAETSIAAAASTMPLDQSERIITHAMGKTTVPANPRRVIVLDTGELDSVLALGVTPIGAVEALAGAGYPLYLGKKTVGIPIVGTIAEPNLEAIITLKPDLIISNKVRHENIYPQLSQIAPTVFAERVGVSWKENFKLHAEALGKTAEAAQIEAAYQAHIDRLRQVLGQPEQINVSVLRFLEGQVRQYQRGSFIGTILDDVGVTRPSQQQLTDKTWTELNQELIPQLDVDALFISSYGPAEKTPLSRFRSDPLWQQLKVVQQNRVYEVADDHWMLGLGYLAAEYVLDDLSRYLARQ